MAEFTEVMGIKKRMCDKNHCSNCSNCGLEFTNNSLNMNCTNLMKYKPEVAEKIIMEWGKEHPIKRNIDVLNETFGKTFLFGNCDGLECPADIDCKDCDYHMFWEREYVEKNEI